MSWYYMDGEEQKGPVDVERSWVSSERELPPEVQVWAEGAGVGGREHLPQGGGHPAKGLPQHASERMAEMLGREGRPGSSRATCRSTSSCSSSGRASSPLGLVVGSSIYHVGFQQSQWSQNQEMAVLSQAMYHARDLAMTRMEAEADALGADGIVGVRLDVGRYEWGENLAEFIAIGTAVKSRDGRATARRTASRSPATLRAGLLRPARDGIRARWAWSWATASTTSRTRGCARLEDDGHQRRDGELHPGPLRRARAGHGAHAGRGTKLGAEGIVGVNVKGRATAGGATSSSTSRSARRSCAGRPRPPRRRAKRRAVLDPERRQGRRLLGLTGGIGRTLSPIRRSDGGRRGWRRSSSRDRRAPRRGARSQASAATSSVLRAIPRTISDISATIRPFPRFMRENADSERRPRRHRRASRKGSRRSSPPESARGARSPSYGQALEELVEIMGLGSERSERAAPDRRGMAVVFHAVRAAVRSGRRPTTREARRSWSTFRKAA